MDDQSSDDASYGLVLPFLDPSPSYAHGVEMGRLCERMKHEDEIKDYVTIENQEQVTLAANRLGWQINKMEPWEGGDWFWLEMHKKGTEQA